MNRDPLGMLPTLDGLLKILYKFNHTISFNLIHDMIINFFYSNNLKLIHYTSAQLVYMDFFSFSFSFFFVSRLAWPLLGCSLNRVNFLAHFKWMHKTRLFFDKTATLRWANCASWFSNVKLFFPTLLSRSLYNFSSDGERWTKPSTWRCKLFFRREFFQLRYAEESLVL